RRRGPRPARGRPRRALGLADARLVRGHLRRLLHTRPSPLPPQRRLMNPLLDPVRELIESGPLAHLVTVNADGSPQVTVVWIGIEDDEIVSGHLSRRRKVEKILRDPRAGVRL